VGRRLRSSLAPRPTGRDRPNSRGDATRLSILAKAEELFAERGIAAVPLRDIGVAAGQKNNVAVQYHFGDRETLVREIAKYRARASEDVRAELFAELFAKGGSPGVRDLVNAFVQSLVCHLDKDNHYLAFLSRYVTQHGSYGDLEGLTDRDTFHRFTAILHRLLPGRPKALVEERWFVVITGAVHTLARYQAALKTGSLPAPLPDLIEDLVTFLSAGLEAPVADASARAAVS
jgi:AcrR family transcriptional regulator